MNVLHVTLHVVASVARSPAGFADPLAVPLNQKLHQLLLRVVVVQISGPDQSDALWRRLDVGALLSVVLLLG